VRGKREGVRKIFTRKRPALARKVGATKVKCWKASEIKAKLLHNQGTAVLVEWD